MVDVVTHNHCLGMLRNPPGDCIIEPQKDDFVDTRCLRYKIFPTAYPNDSKGLKQIIGNGVYAWCTAWIWCSTVKTGIPVMSTVQMSGVVDWAVDRENEFTSKKWTKVR